MKKTLIICGYYPLPESTGSNIRTMSFVHSFLDYGSVDIAYSGVLPGAKVNNSIFSHEYYLEEENVSKIYRWIRIKWQPVQIIKYSKPSKKKLLSLINSNSYDYILVRYIIHTKDLFKLPERLKSRIIIDFDDIKSDLVGSLYIRYSESLFRKLRFKINQKFLKAYEKECLGFGASLFCSEKDRAKMAVNTDSVYVVPNIYNNKSFEDYDFGNGFENENNLLFIGSLDYKPNINGLQWFIESVFPGFKKIYTNSKLIVVGRSPVKAVKMLCENTNDVRLFEDVPDLRKYYKKCKAVIVPLLSGGGTRIKILEAALANRPVLSTPAGVYGLDFTNDTDILLFKNADEISVQYGKMLNRDKYSSLIYNAKNLVIKKYSQQQFNTTMEEVLNALTHPYPH